VVKTATNSAVCGPCYQLKICDHLFYFFVFPFDFDTMKKPVPARVGDLTPSDITVETFLSWVAIVNLNRRRRGEAKGHQILLRTEDPGLLISILLEGTTVDFLFSHDRKEASFENCRDATKAKDYIRSLDRPKQLKVVEFYRTLYAALTSYYKKVESCGCLSECIVVLFIKSDFEKDVACAFDELFRELDADNITQSDQI
jgi:hypothetical protein